MVTGAASGIGAATAIAFAQAGADVALGWLPGDPHDVGPVRAAVEAAGRRAVVNELDVTSTESVIGFVAAAFKAFGRIDICVANAGIARTVPALELTDENWNKIMNVNLLGVWRCFRAALPHMLAAGYGRLLATSAAVIAGITYNFLPFMVLPLYVSLEQVDPRLIEASSDLYANRAVSFLRITLPLSLPGVFAGVLLTFIPAMGDFINAQLLGTPRQYMIGNVIQSQFLSLRDYPTAAALSFVLMGGILVLVLIFARALGTDRLTAGAAA